MEIQIRGKDIDGNEAGCSGAQLAKLIDSIRPDLGNAVWFAAHVDTVTGTPGWYSGQFNFVEVGDTETVALLSQRVLQYLSGVFIALKPEDTPLIVDLEADTEDTSPFFSDRSIIEIRAFDQSYFLIYVHDQALGEQLMRTFKGEVTR